MSKALELREKAGWLVREAKDLFERAERENRSMNKNEQERFDSCHNQAEEFLRDAERHERQARADLGFLTPDEQAASLSAGNTDIGGGARLRGEPWDGGSKLYKPGERIGTDGENLSLGRAIRAAILGDWTGAQAEKRVLGEAVGASGGWLVPTGMSTMMIDAARNASACIAAGAATLVMNSPEVTVNRVLTDPVAYWCREGGSITESSPTFGPVRLKAVDCGVLVTVNNALLRDAENSSALIQQLIASAIALELDRAALVGLGAGEPRGIVETDGVQEYSMGTNGATLASTGYAPFSYAWQSILQENFTPNAVIYNARTAGAIDRLVDGDSVPAQPPASWSTMKAIVTNQIGNDFTQGSETEASLALVGDFSKLLFGIRQELEINVNPFSSFSGRQTQIRGVLRADTAVLRPKAFCKIVGIKA